MNEIPTPARKGDYPDRHGPNNPNSKLTWTKIAAIRKPKTVKLSVLAERFGVSVSTISMIRRDKLWPESERPPVRKYTKRKRSRVVPAKVNFVITSPKGGVK